MTANPADMTRVSQALTAMCEPVETATALSLIERLARHYPRQVRNEQEAELLLEDWLEDVGHIPADILKAACAEYRRDGSNRFMATPGKIRDLASPVLSFRKRLAQKAQRVVMEQAA